MTLLLNAGSDPNVRSITGKSPLHEAIEIGSPDVVGVLLAAGANPNLEDEAGVSPRSLLETVHLPDRDRHLIAELLE